MVRGGYIFETPSLVAVGRRTLFSIYLYLSMALPQHMCQYEYVSAVFLLSGGVVKDAINAQFPYDTG